MSVFKRIVIKVIIILLVICAAAGGAVGWQGSRQSTPEYAMQRYLSLLIDNNGAKAYELLDQSENTEISEQEYETALEARKYSLYSSCRTTELETRRDNNGSEYVDYRVEFLDAADEVQQEETLTVKKQSETTLGIFDKWKVLAGHCMVENFLLTVPAGSEVYINNEKADTSWLVTENVLPSCNCYQIPTLIPGKSSLVIRHPALESVNTTLDAFDASADYTAQMPLKESAQDECKELGVNALKQLYSSSATEKTDDLGELFGDCEDAAKAFVKKQAKLFHEDGTVFKNIAVSNFGVQFGDPVFTEEANGAITVEMTFSYHYAVHEDISVDTEEYDEEGNPIQTTESDTQSGDTTAKLVLAWYEGAWHIASIDVPTVPNASGTTAGAANQETGDTGNAGEGSADTDNAANDEDNGDHADADSEADSEDNGDHTDADSAADGEDSGDHTDAGSAADGAAGEESDTGTAGDSDGEA